MVVRRQEIVLALFLSCFLAQVSSARTPQETRVGCPAGFQASWSYSNPFNWGSLCPYYATCDAGFGQSPINVPTLADNGRKIAPLRFNFSKETLKLIRVGNYLNFPVTQSVSTLRWRDTPNRELVFTLSRIEFHSPSEHTLQGQRAALEVQLYFSYNDTRGVREVAVAQLYNVGTCPDSFLNNIVPALPRRGSCSCGNNRTESFAPFSEQCDSGNLNSDSVPNACRTNCRLPRCGDGVVDAGEQCDLGTANAANGTCRNCKLPTCGDGITDRALGEQCDDNNNFSGDGCAGNCTLECGNGCLEPGEECDDGPRNSDLPTTDTRTCRTNCRFQRCGDSITDVGLGEVCDGQLSCRANCTLRRCGDGFIDSVIGETCDPPNANANCSTNCTRIPRCGDRVLDAGEQCDDASTYCQANCTTLCGDGIIQAGFETCDNGRSATDGNSNTRPNACRETCRKASCGDGIVDPVNCEQCDNGQANSMRPNACRPTCKNPICGDNITDSGEQCDDGNNVDNDGCTCCRNDCGNGIVDNGEECDDGSANDNTNPDRCRTSCRIHFCGDGVVDFDEECDFASSAFPNCTRNCTRPFCGDGIVQSNLGEQCDNGNANSYSALDGCSPICTLNRCGQVTSNQVVDFSSIFGNFLNGTYYYKGSLTHPPCTQNVEWFVSLNIRTISADQYSTFVSTFDANSRPAQGWYNRDVKLFPTTTYGYVPIDRRAINICGDGVVESLEECDNGPSNANIPDACRTNCRAPRCGDGIVDSGEQCDGEEFCTAVCTTVVRPYLHSMSYYDGAVGNLQSPIRLPEACPSGRPLNLNNPANIRYNPTPVILFNTGEDILFPVQNGGTFNWMGHTYTLSWIEFHEPSEHYIGNKRYAFEVQLYHKAITPGDNNVALSVLFDEAETRNAFLDPILNRLPEFSNCQCGNGKKEDVQWARSGNIYKEECDCGKDNNDHTPGTCRTNCRLPYCGDGVQDPCEACDQGHRNSNRSNSCRPNCVLPFCGDGIVDDFYGEKCDDGNNRAGDGCDSNCQRECGNGVLDANEQCDEGVYNSDSKANECRTNCRMSSCGDGVIDFNEECDSGTGNSNTASNACRTSCRLPVCGDGVVDSRNGETCDDGNTVSLDGCDSTCHSECGNGRVEGNEECDDGSCNSNAVPNACRLNCRRPRCGDGVRDSDEQCDTGANTAQCANCIVRCGNGVLESGEECDNGIYNSDSLANGCRSNCRLASCGDGILDALEECDNGTSNGNSSDRCRTWCRIPKCGDGIVDAGNKENCDDGNTLDGDGCDSCCKRECGNGRVDPGEQCDAGAGNSNTLPGCCRSGCTFPVCGDGVTDFGEECDNGRNNTWAPNTCRPDCTLPKCGDGIVDHLYGEVCDQQSRNSWTTIDGCSPTCTPNICRQSVALNTTVNPADWIPKQAGVYYYKGSYSDAPYTENFDWFVFATPQTISTCQLNQFRKVLADNARCLQARNNRPVTYLQINSVCGDGLIEGNEECDNGPVNSDFAPDSCRRNCRLPRCGDGVQDKGEQCDGTPNCTPTCSLSCPGAAEYPQVSNATASPNTVVDENIINVNFDKLFSS